MCRRISKGLLICINVLIWLFAGALVYVGVKTYQLYRSYGGAISGDITMVPAAVLASVGVIFFIIGLIGMCGACKEQKCLLGTFFIIMLLMFMALIGILVMFFVVGRNIDFKSALNTGLQNYGTGPPELNVAIDLLQSSMMCCGVNGYLDWMTTPWYANQFAQGHITFMYPESCCYLADCRYTTPLMDDRLYTKGCLTELTGSVHSGLNMAIGVTVAVLFIQLVGMICSCVVMYARPSSKNTPYVLLVNQSQPSVYPQGQDPPHPGVVQMPQAYPQSQPFTVYSAQWQPMPSTSNGQQMPCPPIYTQNQAFPAHQPAQAPPIYAQN